MLAQGLGATDRMRRPDLSDTILMGPSAEHADDDTTLPYLVQGAAALGPANSATNKPAAMVRSMVRNLIS